MVARLGRDTSPLFEISRLLVHLYQIARFIVNTSHSIMCPKSDALAVGAWYVIDFPRAVLASQNHSKPAVNAFSCERDLSGLESSQYAPDFSGNTPGFSLKRKEWRNTNRHRTGRSRRCFVARRARRRICACGSAFLPMRFRTCRSWPR